MSDRTPVVVIVGGRFAGLSAAKALRGAPVRVLIDRNNPHLFSPTQDDLMSAERNQQ